VSLPRRRRLLFGAITMGLAVLICGGILLAADIYLHHRVENLGGVNVWGYRGPTVPRKQPRERRVVVLGGSTAFGYGLPWNEAFPFYLEQQLNARAGRRGFIRVINLGAPGQGAYGFRFDLDDYAYLHYDVAVLYEGYNDLGASDLPEAVPPRTVQNRWLWRRQSPVFTLTGYLPVLPLVLREKAMALRAGGDLDAAYRGRVTFTPGLALRTTAAAMQQAADVADAVGQRLGQLTARASETPPTLDTTTWTAYTTAVVDAVHAARARDSAVVVVTQPYASDTHVAQQRALEAALTTAFASDDRVRRVNLGRVLNIRDRNVAYDGLHLTARANAIVAAHLADPVLSVTP
jgi:hypothetical protein